MAQLLPLVDVTPVRNRRGPGLVGELYVDRTCKHDNAGNVCDDIPKPPRPRQSHHHVSHVVRLSFKNSYIASGNNLFKDSSP
ncbi:hypothetical protein ACIBEF_32060 [Micromonospora sp. NPDC050795]|uniref:hypothetical protein n=1 Tax=Micromonospora sp. NPDC050795 TaxID=3364282 RepID=UPI0037A70ACF